MKQLFAKLYPNSFQEFALLLEKNLKEEKKMFIVTANPETFMIAEQNLEFLNLVLDDDTTVIPDGIGVVKAAQMLNYPIRERIAGIDIASILLKLGNENHKSIFLLGATENVKEKMVDKLKLEYPNLTIKGAINGYGKNKDDGFLKIKKASPDIVLVALGIPHQENLIYKHLKEFKKGIFVGVGGSFDVLSGTKKRAPKIFQKLGLEWFYRLVKEPSRIKRFYRNNIKFILKIRKMKKDK